MAAAFHKNLKKHPRFNNTYLILRKDIAEHFQKAAEFISYITWGDEVGRWVGAWKEWRKKCEVI